MNSISIFILLFCISFVTLAAEGTTLPLTDSSAIELRSFDQSTLEKLKSNPELSYTQAPAVMSLWERFKIWLNRLIESLLQAAASADWVSVLIVALALIAIIYVAMRLMKVDPFTLFYKTQTPLKAGVIEEDIHSLDFEKLIREALQQEQYRQAIRLVFLQALKLLADHHRIHWQPGKTNHDYLDELTDARLRTGFNELNFYFEYAWYGNFAINSHLFDRVKTIYENWKTTV
ncbi:MAG: DUF4129 domain-containing protein [Flammeovirgaceae bacterium]|nr:MAG: DUF4129 domain-containing protein [Flammeovirgaceae bacterium]